MVYKESLETIDSELWKIDNNLSTACYKQALLVSNYTNGLIRIVELLKIKSEERIAGIQMDKRKKKQKMDKLKKCQSCRYYNVIEDSCSHNFSKTSKLCDYFPN